MFKCILLWGHEILGEGVGYTCQLQLFRHMSIHMCAVVIVQAIIIYLMDAIECDCSCGYGYGGQDVRLLCYSVTFVIEYLKTGPYMMGISIDTQTGQK